MENGNEIDDLIKLISKLPGLGPKSAKRIVLKLINNRDELVKPLAKSLADVYKNISRCKICGALKSISIECDYENCKIVDKKYEKICVVENISDQWSIESSNIYKGYFHILGGTISSAGQKKDDLLIKDTISNTHSLGQILYTDYIHIFQISGMILLVAMVGAIVLTFRKREGVKKQSYINQISRHRENSISLEEVKLKSGVKIDD